MHKIIFCIAILTAVVLVGCDSNSTESNNTIEVSGKITDLLTGQPISGATVKTNPGTGNSSTDNNGDFRINVIPGTYQIIASKEGYTSSDAQIIANNNLKINLQLFNVNSSTGLIAHFPLDGTGEDKSQYKNHGQLFKTVAIPNRKNQSNSALSFDSMAIISIPHAAHLSFDSSTSLTITGWVKFLTDQKEFAGIVVKGPQKTNHPGFQLYIANGKNAAFEVTTSRADGYKNFIRCISDVNIKDGQWHFIAGIVDGSNNQIQIYIDGVKSAQQQTQEGLYPGYNNTEPILIGVERNKSVFFNGFIDDIRIYKSAMTQNQITALYNN